MMKGALMLDPASLPLIHQEILHWYRLHGRDLPWRHTPDPYAILVSEVMLQQTGVERVIPKYHAFLERFPSFVTLAEAPVGEVIRLWSGLGYNRRAVNLHRLARIVVEEHGCRLPADEAALRALPGVGPYTAGAILSFAFRQDAPALDTNHRRVLGRLFLGGEAPPGELARVGRAVIPPGRGYDWNQALMDFASQQCTLTRPACLICPVRTWCHWYSEGAVAPPRRRAAESQEPFLQSRRHYRGRLVELLRELPVGAVVPLGNLGPRLRDDWSPEQAAWLAGLAGELAREGLVRVDEGSVETRISLP